MVHKHVARLEESAVAPVSTILGAIAIAIVGGCREMVGCWGGEALKSKPALRAVLLHPLIIGEKESVKDFFFDASFALKPAHRVASGGRQTPTPEKRAPVKTPHLVTPEPTNTRNTSAGG